MQRGGWGFLSSQQVAGSLPPICVSLSPTDEVRGLDGVEAKLSPKFLNGQPRKYLFPGQNLELPATHETSKWCELFVNCLITTYKSHSLK